MIVKNIDKTLNRIFYEYKCNYRLFVLLENNFDESIGIVVN